MSSIRQCFRQNENNTSIILYAASEFDRFPTLSQSQGGVARELDFCVKRGVLYPSIIMILNVMIAANVGEISVDQCGQKIFPRVRCRDDCLFACRCPAPHAFR